MLNKSFKEETGRLRLIRKVGLGFLTPVLNERKTQRNLARNRKKDKRFLEVGPGNDRVPNFETCNIIDSGNADYILDIADTNLFRENEFDVIYASHVMEHVPWYETSAVIKKLHHYLKPGGWLEIWVPDGLKIANAFVNAENNGSDSFKEDNWFRFNEKQDPCVWAAGRIFTYGDGEGTLCHPNWHRALFSERYLKSLFIEAGFKHVDRMTAAEVRGYDHGWINLGVKGQK